MISVFGRRVVLEALAMETVEFEGVVVDEKSPKEFRKELRAACRERGVEVREVSAGEVGRVSGASRHDQGVAARVRLLNVSEAEGFLGARTGRGAARATRLIALDGVTNPQNVGMIVRSAAASGMGGILWPTVGTPWVSGLVIKASAGTALRLPIVRCETLAEGLWSFKGAGFGVVGLEGGGHPSLFSHEPSHRAVYVLGSETEGISGEVSDLLDERVSIPMEGGVESLNVAVAASLVCFAVGGSLGSAG